MNIEEDSNKPALFTYTVMDGIDEYDAPTDMGTFTTKEEAEKWMGHWIATGGTNGGPRPFHNGVNPFWIKEEPVYAKATDYCISMWEKK